MNGERAQKKQFYEPFTRTNVIRTAIGKKEMTKMNGERALKKQLYEPFTRTNGSRTAAERMR